MSHSMTIRERVQKKKIRERVSQKAVFSLLCAEGGGECEGERGGVCAGGVRGEGVEGV